MVEKSKMELFLNPKSVAVIGASRKTGLGSFNVLENMREIGFQGEIYPVNPKADSILGIPTFTHIEEVEKEIDLAIISTPRKFVPDIVKDCADSGIGAIIIITQGFAEADERGRELQNKIDQIIEKEDIRVLGPNTMGVFNYHENFTTSFVPFKAQNWEPVSLVSQTGLFFARYTDFKVGKAIDIGNACDVDHVDALRYLKDDPETEQIFLHIEGVKRGEDFLKYAKKTTPETSILALKGGTSEVGKEMAESHTGSMAGEKRIYEGIFQQSGILGVKDSHELQVFSKALLNLPKMKGRKIAIITHAGAGGIIAADAAEEFGLEIAQLSENTVEKIQSLSPDWLEIGNPVDIWPGMMIKGPEILEISLNEVLSEESVDGMIGIFPNNESTTYPEGSYGDLFDKLIEITSKHNKPVTVWLQGTRQKRTREKISEAENVIAFDNARDAAKALSILFKNS